MRARILWAATLAVLLFGLAVGPAPARVGPLPVSPLRAGPWSLPCRRTFTARRPPRTASSRTPGGYSTSGHDPGHLLPLQPGQRALGDYPAGDARRGGNGLGGLLPDLGQDLRVRRLRSNTGVFSNATRVFDMATGTWGSAANMPGPRAFMASGFNARTARSISSAGTTRGPVERAGDDVGVRPCGEHVHYARADSARRRRHRFGVIGGHLYLAGGRDALGDVVDLVWDYNIARTRGRRRPPCRARRTLPAAPPPSGKLWSFGGETLQARSGRPRPTTR